MGATEVKKYIIGEIHLLHEIPGYSAYEIAVKNGFKGTESEWLKSLIGPKGDIGTLESHSDIDAQENRVINVAEPVEKTDAATKKYVDDKRYSADDVGSIVLHRALTPIGLKDDETQYTIEQVCEAVPLWSKLILCTSKSKITDLPMAWGTLEIVKGDSNYCVARVTNSSSVSTELGAYMGRYAPNQTAKWSGWFKIDLSVVDISNDFIQSLGTGITATVKQVYKQGNIISGCIAIECSNIKANMNGALLFTVNDKYSSKLQFTLGTCYCVSANLKEITPVAGTLLGGNKWYVAGLSGDTLISVAINFTYMCK